MKPDRRRWMFLNQKCDIAIPFGMPGRRIKANRLISPILKLKLVAMETSLEQSAKKVRSSTYDQITTIWHEDLVKISPVDPEINNLSQKFNFKKKQKRVSKLWSYWTESHQIFKQCRETIADEPFEIRIAILQSVLLCQGDERSWVGRFCLLRPENWLPWQRPLIDRKNRVRSAMHDQKPTIRWKCGKNWFGGSWDNLSEMFIF